MIRTIIDFLRLKHSFKVSKKKLEAYQLKQIKKLVRYAKTNSDYYQESIGDLPLNSLADFHAFPSINKRILMAHFDAINTVDMALDEAMAYALEKELSKDYLGYYKDNYVLGLSSGTSGNKGLYITTKAMTKRLPGLFLARGGIHLSDLPLKILFCLRVFSQGFDDINAPFLTLKYQSTMAPIEETMTRLHEESFNLLMAPPSFLRQLIKGKVGLKGNLLRIITYAEVLTSEDKALFERYFKTEVVEIYQASEGQIASPCKKGFLHINEDLVYIELYDSEGNFINTPHKRGHKMVLTNLVNYAQPLIRYEMNDMIILDEACPCGSHFRRIKQVLGRHDDLIKALDEEGLEKIIYPDMFARWIITESDAISEFQVYQEALGAVKIILDLNSPFDPKELSRRIDKELKALNMKLDITIELETITLPKDFNKFKRFISQI